MYKKLRFLVILRKRTLWKLEYVLYQGVHSAPRLYHDHFHRHRSLDQLVPAAASPCPTPQGAQPNILELFQIFKNISIPARCPTKYFSIIQNTSKYLAHKVFQKILKKNQQSWPARSSTKSFKKSNNLPRKVFHPIFKIIPSILKYLPRKVFHQIFQNYSKYFKM